MNITSHSSTDSLKRYDAPAIHDWLKARITRQKTTKPKAISWRD